jgi:hypothetical protein
VVDDPGIREDLARAVAALAAHVARADDADAA